VSWHVFWYWDTEIPLRTDDGLGWQVAVELFRTNTSPEVDVLPCHQLTPELAEAVSVAETVLFIDCARWETGRSPLRRVVGAIGRELAHT
jgi:Ni,Fe-hydrogenase maturation factor